MENSEILDIAAGNEFSLILIRTQDNHTVLVYFGTDIINKYANIPNTSCQKLEKLPEGVENITKIIAFEKEKYFVLKITKFLLEVEISAEQKLMNIFYSKNLKQK